ncbi:MAG: polysaccharide deacetylase family protein [Clostridia bacterium]|nr:polysaccharide deacetylase family protein [Clostridia bacterium]
MKKTCLLLLLLICLSVSAASGEGEFYTEMPALLSFTQNTNTQTVAENVFIEQTYPDTASDMVDARMRALIDEMTENNRSLLPVENADLVSYLDVGAVVSRSGTSVLSFLTLAEVSRDTAHLSVDYQTRVYDLETEKELTLSDFFAPDSDAWALLSAAVREQLSAAFPALEPDAAMLDRLCAAESLMHAPFTLGAARLTLTYRADALYPGKNTLLHVHVYYPEIRHLMTPYGQAQTDNSRFRMVALTYDDGPSRRSTRRVLNELRSHGAQATFFIVGRNIARNHDILSRQQNSGYSIQSHSYTHIYPRNQTTKEIFAEDEMLRRELSEVIGLEPTMMRAPGGMYPYYIRRKMGYPMINWSLASGDSGNDNVRSIAYRLQNRAANNDVILMHDLNSKCHEYSAAFLDHLCANGYLCVTVEELFSRAGVPLEPDTLYYSPDRIGK